jgi:YhcH/YjgK/YiaL family protein
MFYTALDNKDLWAPLLDHPVLYESLEWLRDNASSAEFGNYEFDKAGWYANTHGYETLPVDECIWENHKHTVDTQYLVSGSEGIRWDDVQQLGELSRYIEDQDREEYDVEHSESSLLVMKPGTFALFLPGEAHCPKIALQKLTTLRKVVVKIPFRLIEGRV